MLAKLFWLAVSIIAYTFLGYPLLISVLARLSPKPVQRDAITPTITLLIPAYNEADVIIAKLQNSLALGYPTNAYSIVVVTDGSDDATPELARQYAGGTVPVFVYHQSQRRGKAAAINRVMPFIESDLVVFSDANAMLESDALQTIVRNFADTEVGGVAGEKRVLGGGEGLYWRYESYLKRCDSAVTSVVGAAGELFAIRRELFQPLEEDSLIEDFILSMRLVRDGWRVVYEPAAIAWERAPSCARSDWERRTRIAAGGIQSIWRLRCLMHPARGLIAWQFISHRVLRWAVAPFLLPLAYLLNLGLCRRPRYRCLWWVQTTFYALGLLGIRSARNRTRQGLSYAIFYFCFTNLAAIVGFWRYVARRQPVTWKKAR